MTRRLTIAFVAIVLATLAVVAVGTLVIANVRARATTEADLRSDAAAVARSVNDIVTPTSVADETVGNRLRVLANLRDVLRLGDLSVIIDAPSRRIVAEPLPAGLNEGDLPSELFARASLASGHRGNVVWAAASTRAAPEVTVVVVLAREANAGWGASVRWFFFAAAATLLLGVAAALLLARRLSRPIRRASATARQIAEGDFAARVPLTDTGEGELGELGASINHMAASLDESRTREQQFLLSVSHDLRTPLTSIRGFADAIADGAADPMKAATIIRAESQRLERLVADLLDLARLRSTSFAVSSEQVDVNLAGRLAVEGVGPDAAERDVVIDFRPAAQAALVVADRDRWGQVMANLLENALKYATSGVVVEVSVTDSTVSFTVDDDGPGIPPAERSQVFERLYVGRARPRRAETSSGLGLAIAYELVSGLGGSIEVTDRPGGGARFVVQLPRVGS